MLIGRFLMIVPVLAMARFACRQKIYSSLERHFSDAHSDVRGALSSVIIIVGALTYFPALTLGPIVEQLLMVAGVLQ